MSEERRVLLVGGAQAPGILQGLERRGLRAVVLGVREVLERSPVPECADHCEALELSRPLPALVRGMTRLVERFECRGIVPVLEYALVPAAMAAEQLGLPGPSVRTVMNTRDKLRMRRVLEAAGLGQVRHAGCRTVDDARAFLAASGGPVVVKPILGTASDGVSRVDRPEQLEAAFALASQARAFGGVLCEELVDGPEVSVEGYSTGGVFVPVAITDKLTDERFLEVGHSQPSAQPLEARRAVADLAARTLRALGVREGVSHTEIRIASRGPVLIETHTRMGGGNIHLLTERTTGVDLADLMVGFALGETPVSRPRPAGRGAAVRFLVGRPGTLASVEIPPLEEGIEEARVYRVPGEVVTGRSSSLDRLGHVVALGPSAGAALAAAEAFLARIRVGYEGEEPWTAQVA